jgi:hypothetical protein
VIPDEPVTDVEGYLVPVDSPLYIELEPPDEQTFNDENDNPQNENKQQHSSHGGGVGRNVNTPSVVPGPSGVAGTNRYVTKQRRRPPSPPRKINDGSSSGNDNRQSVMRTGAGHCDAIDVHRKGVGLDDDSKSSVYESLKEDHRVVSVYEPLDRTSMSNN